MLRRTLSVTLVAVLLAGGCTGSGDSAVEDATSSTAALMMVPATTSTTAVVTTTTTATTVPSVPAIPDDIVWVDFDGQECVVSGPTAISAGSAVPVVLTNASDIVAKAVVARIRPSSAMTFEDFVELQQAAGGVLWDDLDNLSENSMQWLSPEGRVFPWEDVWPELELADDQSLKVIRLRNDMGDDVIFVSTQGEFNAEHGVIPEAYWFCAPFEVTAIEF